MNEASTTWALVVGIDQYDSSNVPPLQGAIADAVAAVGWLRNLGVPDGQILLNASAGPASKAALQALTLPYAAARKADIAGSIHHLSQVVGGTRLLVFLCGHGFYEPSSGRMFLVQDFDTNGQWPNLGIKAYVEKFLSLPFRRQFLFMDGCLNYPYPEPLRPRFLAEGPSGGAPEKPPAATMVTCFAASVGEWALERNGRGLFLSSLLPQLDPANPCADYPNALTYSFDEGTRTVDLDRLMDPYITELVSATTASAQHPRVFVEGVGESVDGAHPLFRVLPDLDTVTVSLTVTPSEAAVDVKRLSVWIEDPPPPFPSKYLYQPPPLVVPVQLRLPLGADGVALCELRPNSPWAEVSTRWPFKADTDQPVSFSLTHAQYQPALAGPVESGPLRFSVKVRTPKGHGYGALRRPEANFPGRTSYDQVTSVIGLPEVPADNQAVADGVTVTLHEDGPQFTAENWAAKAGAETAAAWASAVQAVLPQNPDLPEDLRVTTIVRGDIAPKYEKLRLELPDGGARRLAGPLASHPAVVIERGPVTRPPAWRLTSSPASEQLDGVEEVLSLSELEQRPGVAIQPGPVRVSVELPWGSWTEAVQVPAWGIEQIDLPTTIGVPPLRVALADDLSYLAERDRAEQPMILGLQGDTPPQATLVNLVERHGTDPEVVASPSASAAWSIAQPGRDGVLRLEGPTATLFPLAGRSLAVDRADGMPRVEPLSATAAPEWDLLIGTGQLEVLETWVARDLAVLADDELLRLACAYVLYARREWMMLNDVMIAGGWPRQLDLDEALLLLAAAYAGLSFNLDGRSWSEDLAMEGVRWAAEAGQVPLLRWGVDLALTVLTAEALHENSKIAAWYAALAAIRPRLSPRSVWTSWTENRP
jgi:hypothetical protein